MTVSADKFAERLVASKLMTINEFSSFIAGLSNPPDDAEGLAKALVRGGKLTRYQATAIYQGKTRMLRLGEYLADSVRTVGAMPLDRAASYIIGKLWSMCAWPHRTALICVAVI